MSVHCEIPSRRFSLSALQVLVVSFREGAAVYRAFAGAQAPGGRGLHHARKSIHVAHVQQGGGHRSFQGVSPCPGLSCAPGFDCGPQLPRASNLCIRIVLSNIPHALMCFLLACCRPPWSGIYCSCLLLRDFMRNERLCARLFPLDILHR